MQTNSEFESKEPGLGYGGWLRCFRVFNGINWGIGVLVVLALPPLFLLTWGNNSQNDLNLIASLVRFVPGAVISFLIWKPLLMKSDKVPSKINWLMRIDLALSFVAIMIIYYLYVRGYVSEKPAPILFGIIYYVVCSSYFKRSKRVASYYGVNS